MSLVDLSTKLGNDEAAFNTLNSQVEGLLVKAGVMSLAALSNKLDEAGEAYTTLQGEVDAVLAATTGVAGGLPALRMAYDTAKTDYDTLNMQVNTVLAATTGVAGGLPALQTAYDAAKMAYDTLNGQVNAVLAATETTTGGLPALQTAVANLRIRVAELEGQLGQAQQGQQQAQQQAQTLEANQRAENLRVTFQGSDGMTDLTSPLVDSRVTITVPTRNRLTFEYGDRTVRTISAPGLRGARLTGTRGGALTDVVYTDRELSRVLLDHYASTESDDNPGQFTLPSLTSTTNLYHQTTSTLTIPERLLISSRGGLPSLIPADETDREREEVRTSFSGSVQGVSGTFRCQGDGCMLTATGTYNNADDDNNPDTRPLPTANRLNGVTLETSGMIYFKPSSATASVSLCADTSQCLIDDTEYMAFGWWREEPTNALSAYKFGVFAEVEGGAGANSALTGTAEYDGTAVGMYVEQGGLGGTGITTRQGEFAADVRLDANFSDPDSGGPEVVGIKGTIDGFRTTPTGGSAAPTTSSTWVVKLVGTDGAGNMGDHTDATIDIRGTTSTGAWSHAFVGNHATAPTGDNQLQPPAVTGMFNTRIPNLLHLVGAFGAELQ